MGLARRSPPKVSDIAKATQLMRDGEVPVVRALATVERNTEGGFDFVMSDATVDRYGDTVAASGWKVDGFLKNPVLLWMHDRSLPPIGKVGSVAVEGQALKAKNVTFTPADMAHDAGKFGAQIGELYKAGFLNGVSVGFLPIKWVFNDKGGIDFVEQELLELSAVTVPANANALLEARSRGLVNAAMLKALGVEEEPAKEAPIAEVVDLAAAVRENTAVVRELLAFMAGEKAERAAGEVQRTKRLSSLPTNISAADIARDVVAQLNRSR